MRASLSGARAVSKLEDPFDKRRARLCVVERFLVNQWETGNRRGECLGEQSATGRSRIPAAIMNEHACGSTTGRACLEHETADAFGGEQRDPISRPCIHALRPVGAALDAAQQDTLPR